MKKEKNKISLRSILVPAIIFLLGAGIFLYPAISNFFAVQNQAHTIKEYQVAVQNTGTEELDAMWKEAEIYNENLAGDPVHDPFVPGSGYVLPDNYKDVLNIDGDGIMGYVEIPKINVYLPIYHGTSTEVLEKGAGPLQVTYLPIGGANRHSVISAHRGLPSAELFTRLDEMKEGDIFFIHVLEKTLEYKVDQITVIDPKDIASLRVEEGKDLVTLLTCTPYAVNTHRLLVRGEHVIGDPALNGGVVHEEHVSKNFAWVNTYVLSIILGLFLLVLLLVLLLVRKKKNKNKKGRKKHAA